MSVGFSTFWEGNDEEETTATMHDEERRKQELYGNGNGKNLHCERPARSFACHNGRPKSGMCLVKMRHICNNLRYSDLYFVG